MDYEAPRTYERKVTDAERDARALLGSLGNRSESDVRAHVQAQIAKREAQAQAEHDAIAQHAAEQRAAAIATPEGRAAAARRAAEDEAAAGYQDAAQQAEARAASGLRHGDVYDRLQGTRDGIRAKAAALLVQTSDSNGQRA